MPMFVFKNVWRKIKNRLNMWLFTAIFSHTSYNNWTSIDRTRHDSNVYRCIYIFFHSIEKTLQNASHIQRIYFYLWNWQSTIWKSLKRIDQTTLKTSFKHFPFEICLWLKISLKSFISNWLIFQMNSLVISNQKSRQPNVIIFCHAKQILLILHFPWMMKQKWRHSR